MVAYKDILSANALISESNAPQVAVFAGGTSGTGKYTVKALVSTGVPVKIYLIGRKSSESPMQDFIQELKAINPKAEIIWTEAEISLLAETKRVCEIIKAKESRVDLLMLTAGYAPFKGREVTSEGLEITQVLEYYSRMLFITLLLPLLEKSEAPRVISVLGGGLERTTLDIEDLNMEKPGNFGGMKAQPHFIAMNTLFMDKLAVEHPDISFIHSWPGFVSTGNAGRSAHPYSLAGWLFWGIIGPLFWAMGMDHEVAGQRYLFLATSQAFGGKGIPWKGKVGVNTRLGSEGGLFLTNYKCDCTPNEKNLSKLREFGQGAVWEKTQEVLGPYL
jgi:NAD(P)-dependent dehydrogenase (short-subunit alcohol dehydrogenase family)